MSEKREDEDRDPFLLYAKEIRAHPILTAEEEFHYVTLAKSGDLNARNHMVKCNLRLVVKIAMKFINRGLSISDLVSEGNFGLFKSLEKFDPNLGFKFSTYATWWITQSINHAILNKARTIRVPIHNLNIIHKYIMISKNLPLDITDKSKYISEKLKITEEKMRWIDYISNEVSSFEDLLQSWEDRFDEPYYSIPRDIYENGARDCKENPEIIFGYNQFQEKIQSIFSILTHQEKDVIIRRFGFDNGKKQTLESISKMYNRTRERIRQIQDSAMKKIRAYFEEHKIEMESFL